MLYPASESCWIVGFTPNSILGSCGSGVELGSCWSLVRFPWSAYQSVIGQDTEPQTAPDVLVGTLNGSRPATDRIQSTNVWITVSCFGPKCLINV